MTKPLPHATQLALAALATTHATAQSTYTYANDDGSGFTSSALANYDARVTWGNSFAVDDPFTTIIAVQASFAQGFPNLELYPSGHPITVALWEDPTNDRDPRDATLIATADHLVTTGTGPEDFLTFQIAPTTLTTGSFFVGIIADLEQGQLALRQDLSTLGTTSWRFDNAIGEDNFDLSNAGFAARTGDFGFGTWMVRALAVPSPASAPLLILACLGINRSRARR